MYLFLFFMHVVLKSVMLVLSKNYTISYDVCVTGADSKAVWHGQLHVDMTSTFIKLGSSSSNIYIYLLTMKRPKFKIRIIRALLIQD